MNHVGILILSAITSVKSTWNLQTNTVQEDLMATALASIIVKVYSQQSTNVFITSNTTDVRHNAILRKVFGALDKSTSITWILHDEEYLNGNVERFSNIILIDSHDSLGLIIESVTNTTLEHFGLYTVAITNFNDDPYLNTKLIDMFSVFWRYLILDVNILTYSSKSESLLLHTYFPFAPTHCNKVVPVILNAFKGGRFVETDQQLFPLKTGNLFQCPIPVVVAQLRPYIYVTRNHSDGSHDFEGFEYNLLCELAKQLNFQLNITVFWDEDTEDVWDLMLYLGYNMLVGGFVFTPNVEEILSSTKAYSSDNIVVVVPNPRPYSSFETLFFPFTLTLWIFLLVIIAAAVTVITVLQCYGKEYYELVVGARNPNPYFSLLRALLTGETSYTPHGSVAKFILMVWMLTCLILQTVYQGQLFNFMKTNATVASVQTIDELIEKGISIKMIYDSYIDYFEYDLERLEKLLIFVNGSTEYKFVTETEGYVTMEIQLIDEIRRKKPETIPEAIKVVLAPHVIDLQERSHLKHSMDNVVSYVNENGLMAKWTAPYKASSITNKIDKRIPRQLTILHILGVVQVCFGALILSTLVFICEVMSAHLGHGKKRIGDNFGEVIR